MERRDDTSWDKRAVLEDEIHPLVTRLAEICNREGIPFFMTFHYLRDAERGRNDVSTSGTTGSGDVPASHPVAALFALMESMK